MAAELPYLPPLQRYAKDVANIASSTADDVRAAQGLAAKAGLIARGGLAMVPPIAGMAVEGTGVPTVMRAGNEFIQNMTRGPQNAAPAPTLGLPALAAPATAAPAAAPAPPATSLPVMTTSKVGDLTVAHQGNQVAIVGDRPSVPQPVEFVNNGGQLVQRPVSQGVMPELIPGTSARSVLAKLNPEEQRMHIAGAHAAAYIAAQGGNAHDQAYAYNAALQAIPTMAGVEERRQASKADVDQKNNALRHNVQPTVIGEEVNPDPTTRPFAPTIKKYGFVTAEPQSDGSHKITVRDMQGTVMKPPAPPVSRADFIAKNKKANPSMSESDIGREYDKKYKS
jgi:hypothetical protein